MRAGKDYTIIDKVQKKKLQNSSSNLYMKNISNLNDLFKYICNIEIFKETLKLLFRKYCKYLKAILHHIHFNMFY